jgi:Putative restriction endonuclease
MTALAIPTETALPVSGPPQGHWTHADWEALPDHDAVRYEVIDGVLYMTTAPSNAAYDEQIKLEAYERAGLPEYVIVDPRSRELLQYRRGADGSYGAPDVRGEHDGFAFACLPALTFRVADLFAGAPDTTL